MGTISRRRLLAMSGTAGLGLLAACSAPPASAPKPTDPRPTEAPKPVATATPTQVQPGPTAAPAAAPTTGPAAQKAPATASSSRDSFVFAQTQDQTSLDPPMHSLIRNNTVVGVQNPAGRWSGGLA